MKTALFLLFMLVILILAIAGLVHEARLSEVAPSGAAQIVPVVVSRVHADSMMQSVRFLSGQKTRRFASEGAEAAVAFITRQLTALGLPVEHQLVEVTGPDGRSATVTNVVSALTGSADGGTLVLCAHYDSRSQDGRESAPGADDNASGVAVLIEVARVLAGADVRAGVSLAFFGGEEDNLIGSNAFAETLPRDGRLLGIMNVDMVGYDRHGPKDVVLFTNEASMGLAASVAEAAYRFTDLRVETVVTEYGNSDHASFWKYGHPAVALWEGFDHNPLHHSEMDVAANLTPGFLAEVTRLVVAVALCAADEQGLQRPADVRRVNGPPRRSVRPSVQRTPVQ